MKLSKMPIIITISLSNWLSDKEFELCDVISILASVILLFLLYQVYVYDKLCPSVYCVCTRARAAYRAYQKDLA